MDNFCRQKGVGQVVIYKRKHCFKQVQLPLGEGKGYIMQITLLVLIRKFQTG